MLRDILSELSEATSISLAGTDNRAQLLRFVNRAAREFYSTADFPGTLFEQTFEIHEENQQISLPWYVDQVRLIRRANSRTRTNTELMAPRYHSGRWKQPYNVVRVMARRALHTPLTVESQLTATIAIAQTEPFTVTITGQTPSASTISETLTFLAGELTKTTTAQFSKDEPIGVEAISKSAITTCDVIIKDATAVEIALLPARLTYASHVILMTNDYDLGAYSNTTDNEIELLYKRTFTPVYYDTDEFFFPALETAILWKARSYAHSMAKDEDARAQAILTSQKADTLASDVIANTSLEAAPIMSLARMPGERAYRGAQNIFGAENRGFAW